MPAESGTMLVNNNNEDFMKMHVHSSETAIKEESLGPEEDSVDECSSGDKSPEEDDSNYQYSMSSLPLEVITTIEPYNYPCPPLKHMSNGNLTHRNIFTEQEREVLRNVVEKYRTIVDTRKRTRETYIEKQTVWQQIVEEFNGSDNVMIRTEKELKKCWDNMKYRARLAEKEQMRAESINSIMKNTSGSQNMNSNVVQVHAALEKMFALKTEKNTETDSNHSNNDKTDYNHNGSHEMYSDEESDGNDEADRTNPVEDDEQPLLKKARQESPKLSSILLGEVKMPNSPYKTVGSNGRTQASSISSLKSKKKNPITILPKSLSSCVSITNIPNPHNQNNNRNHFMDSDYSEFCSSYGPINLGSGVTISPQNSNSFPKYANEKLSSLVKPMPNLKKMLPSKIKSAKDNFKNLTNGNDLTDSIEFNEEKLLNQRLGFETKEHNLRMKVLEKQLQAHYNEAQYWELKIQLLKSGQDYGTKKLPNGTV